MSANLADKQRRQRLRKSSLAGSATHAASQLIERALNLLNSKRVTPIDIEASIHKFKRAIRVLRTIEGSTRRPVSGIKVRALEGLGRAYLLRGRGSPSGNVERAIRCFEYFESQERGLYLEPPYLAIAYDRRVIGSRSENIDKVLVHSDSVDLDPSEDAELLARVWLVRGKAFRDRDPSMGVVPKTGAF